MGIPPIGSEDTTGQGIDALEWIPQTVARTIIDSLDSVILDESDGPVILRQVARILILEASQSDDPIGLYKYGISKIQTIQTSDGPRLVFTREYILRIFEQQLKRYEEQVNRTTYSRFEDTMNSASEEIGNINL